MFAKVARRFFGASAGLAIALFSSGNAQAAYVVKSATIDASVGSLNGTVQYTPKSYSTAAAIGRIRLTGTDTSSNASFNWTSYCVDIYDQLSAGTFNAAPTSTLNLSTTKLSQLNALLSNVDPYITDATTSAAAQMAVWEIVYDGSGSYDLTGGTFKVANISADATSDANKMLMAVTSGYWKASDSFSMALLTGANNQTQLVYGTSAKALAATAAAVPEPASWAMMTIGFGALGGALRRKRGEASHAIA